MKSGGCDSEGKSYDFISRYFAAWNGIPEDPVTGNFSTWYLAGNSLYCNNAYVMMVIGHGNVQGWLLSILHNQPISSQIS